MANSFTTCGKSNRTPFSVGRSFKYRAQKMTAPAGDISNYFEPEKSQDLTIAGICPALLPALSR